MVLKYYNNNKCVSLTFFGPAYGPRGFSGARVCLADLRAALIEGTHTHTRAAAGKYFCA